MGTVVFPPSLPSPSVVSMSPAERRLLSSIADGLGQTRPLQSDFLGYENLQWEFTAAQAAVFQSWWLVKLIEGGRWFQAAWPRVSVATSGVCRFLLPPKWDLIGHEYFRVTIGTELRGVALPPLTASLQLGLHFNGDLTDTSRGHTVSEVIYTRTDVGIISSTFPTASPKFGTANIAMTAYTWPLVSDNRGSFVFNVDGEFQISAWVKLAVGVYGYAGGALMELGAWGTPNGNAMSGGGGASPPLSRSGQFQIRLQGGSGGAALQFDYPTFNTSTGFFQAGRLADLAPGTPVLVPVGDGAWHHIGIAGDVNGIRAYIDGVLTQDDGDHTAFTPRPAGQRPMWADTAYRDQRFLIGAFAAGTYSGDYSTYPTNGAFAVSFCGEIDDLEVRNGTSCVTFTGATITVPVAPFVR